MRKRDDLPRNCLIVEKYDELRRLLTAFAKGAYELLCVLGGPGVGKSEMARRIMQQTCGPTDWGMVRSKHSPLDLYQRLYRFRQVPVVLDDLDDLLRKPDNVMMLKCLCDSTPVKRLEWGSNHVAFNSNLPKSFETVSRVCLISNDWNSLDRNISALLDRGVVLHFQPPTIEVHRELAQSGWFGDEEVFDFIGANLFLIANPSFRFYKTAAAHKRAGLDWRDLTLRAIENTADAKTILVARLLANPEYDSMPSPEGARVRAFSELGGGSKATYFRNKSALLLQRGNVDPLEVNEVKLQPLKPDLMSLAMLDRREQIEQPRNSRASESLSEDKEAGSDIGDPPGISRDARLLKRLNEAIAKEDYERAAELRDQIRRISEEKPDDAG